ncbi:MULTISPECIES: hypothetical protein [unclassified Psychrobacter]|uniref:hypothetical protein n=1 Tax=unclassified Psychrobacter TaxID=196806 RepID=UPI0018F5B80C|nr:MULTISPECIES: hypothetical protein [unclassified Psychrobacter]
MIDFFVKEAISDERASLLLQKTFGLPENKVTVLSLQEMEALENQLPKSCDCLGVKSLIEGDACTLLQIHRIDIPLDIFLERLQSFCKAESITCYVPSESVYANSYYNYYEITPDCEMIEVSEWLKDDNEDNKQIYFHNKLTKN